MRADRASCCRQKGFHYLLGVLRGSSYERVRKNWQGRSEARCDSPLEEIVWSSQHRVVTIDCADLEHSAKYVGDRPGSLTRRFAYLNGIAGKTSILASRQPTSRTAPHPTLSATAQPCAQLRISKYAWLACSYRCSTCYTRSTTYVFLGYFPPGSNRLNEKLYYSRVVCARPTNVNMTVITKPFDSSDYNNTFICRFSSR